MAYKIIKSNSIQINSIQLSFFYITGYRDVTLLRGHIKSNKYKILQKSYLNINIKI